jgi:hypothetical protein
MLVQNVKIQLIRPPVPDRRASAGWLFVCSARYRALAIFIHKVSSFGWCLLKIILLLNRFNEICDKV